MARLIDEASERTILTEDNFFYLPATATERVSSHDIPIRPAQAVNDDTNDYVFVVPASYSEFTSLADVRFKCDLVVTPPNNAVFDEKIHSYAPINNILHSLFDSVQVQLNGRVISDSSHTYFLRAYLESLLGYTKQTQLSQLTCAGWEIDTELEKADSSYATPTVAGAALAVHNEGANKRRKMVTVTGSPIQLSGKLHCDLFQQDKPLITGVELTIKMTRTRAKLSFCAADDNGLPTIGIRNPCIWIRRYVPSPAFSNAFAKTILTKSVKYHIPRGTIRTATLTQGLQSSVWSNVACGQLPKTMILGIVSNSAYTGSATETPYAIMPYDLSFISAEIDGINYPSQGYSLDFASNNTLDGYEGLLDTLDRLNDPTGELVFDRYDYKKGYALYGFDFTTAHTGRAALDVIRNGNLNVHFRFGTALPKAVVTFALLSFDNVMQINNNRQVSFDFAP
jgi:hypothetical protein